MTPTGPTAAVSPDGVFYGYAALFATPDLGRDIIQPGAFRASLAARSWAPPLLFMHDPREPIGVLTDIAEDARGLLVRGRLTPGVKRAHEVHALLQAGALDGLSIGFKPVVARRDPLTGLRRLIAVDLFEVSLVTFPMTPGARVLRLPVHPRLDQKYDEEQPRVPKGGPGGGQWTKIGSGDGASGLKPEAQATQSVLRRPVPSLLGPLGPRATPGLGEAPEPPLPEISPRDVRNLDAYNERAAAPSPGRTPVLEMRVVASGSGNQTRVEIDQAREVSRDELRNHCPRVDEVQAAVDRAMARIGPRPANETHRHYGSRVHYALEDEIERINNGRTGEGSLRAEVSFHKGSNDTTPNAPNLIRTDVLEWGRHGTLCVHDLKTGREPLTLARARELGRYVLAAQEAMRRIYLVEVRPRR